MAEKLYEADDLFFILFGILFLAINFEPKVSQIYFAMAMIGAWVYSEIKSRPIFTIPPLKRSTTSWSSGILYGLVGFAVFIFSMPVILNFLGISGYSTPQSIINLMASGFSTKPVLEASKTVSFIVWGQLIPYVETLFFPVYTMLWLSYKFNISQAKLSGMLILMVLVGAATALFHMTAKASYAGIPDNAAIITTFVFFFINTFLVLHFKEKIQALSMHIIGNSIAINNLLKVFNIG